MPCKMMIEQTTKDLQKFLWCMFIATMCLAAVLIVMGGDMARGADALPPPVRFDPLPPAAKPGCTNCSSCGTACSCFGGQYYCQNGKCSVGNPLKPGQQNTELVWATDAATGRRVQVRVEGRIDPNRDGADPGSYPRPIFETGPGVIGTKPVTLPLVPVTRTASGHTHTCANGHTWDHSMDGGSHRCPWCGLPQYVQDSGRRAVTTVVTQPAARGSSFQPFSSGGCTSAGCSVGGPAPADRWYPGKNLGR